MTVERLPVPRDKTDSINGALQFERRDQGAALSPLPEQAIPPIGLHPVEVYIGSLSSGSRRTMRAALEKIARIASAGQATAHNFPWHELRYQHTTAIRSILSDRQAADQQGEKSYAPATTNKMLSALKGVLKECWRLGYISAEDYHRARDVSPIRGSALPKGREIPAGERKALFDAFAEDEKPVRGARDAALVAVLYVCGLRRGEAVGLDLADFDPVSGEVRILAAKGNKQRIVYATGGAGEAIRVWISYRKEEPGPLFCAVLKNERIIPRRLSEQTVYDILRRRGREIAVSRNFSPHDFRRTFVGDVIDAKGDLSVAQKLAGHASPETTARYDRRGERAKKEAAEELYIPYRAPRRDQG